MNGELVRLVDSIHRDKDIDKEVIYHALEDALLSAARKHFGQREGMTVAINRETGEITATDGVDPLDPAQLGRIAAQAAKQVIIQKIKEAESDVIFADFEGKVGDIVNGIVQRVEGPNVIVNLGRVEGILPRREQIREETYRVGERIKCLVVDVKRVGQRVRILLSRTHPDIVRRLFEIEVPEVTERIIEIKELAREPGSRTKLGVTSHDLKVDCVGACVGVRGSRIKNIVAELGGEKIDIVRYSEQPEAFIANALNPAEVSNISLNPVGRRVKVIVAEDQLSLAIGKRGQNVRLAAKLTGWAIDVMSQAQCDERRARTRQELLAMPGVGNVIADRITEAGYHAQDLAAASIEELSGIEGIGPKLAEQIVDLSQEVARTVKAEEDARRAAKRAAQEADVQGARSAADRLFATIDAKDQTGEASAQQDQPPTDQAEAPAEPPAAEEAPPAQEATDQPAAPADEETAEADATEQEPDQGEASADETAPEADATEQEPDQGEASAHETAPEADAIEPQPAQGEAPPHETAPEADATEQEPDQGEASAHETAPEADQSGQLADAADEPSEGESEEDAPGDATQAAPGEPEAHLPDADEEPRD